MKKLLLFVYHLPMRIIGFIRREIFERPILTLRQRSILKRIKSKKKKHKKIDVLFIVQFPEMWNSIKSIYDEMFKDNSFNVNILCVPKFLQESVYKGKTLFHNNNDAKHFLQKLGYKVLDARNEKGAWIKYKKIKSDYVFIQRPYNFHLPKNLRFNILSKYSLICNTPYGYPLSKRALVKISMNYHFLKYATYYFSFDKTQLEYFNKNKFLKFSEGIKISNSARIDLVHKPDKKVAKRIYNVLWTPRWYVGDGPNGKSNFLKYKNVLLDYFKNNLEMTLIIRPHPLMFENFVRVGVMTQNEVDNFINNILNRPNVSLDSDPDYQNSFKNADAIVSDFSSLLYEFILTGKPVLYCGEIDDFNEIAKLISFGFYNIDTSKTLIDRLESLKNGKDDLLDKRFDIINTQISNKKKVSSEIIDYLLR